MAGLTFVLLKAPWTFGIIYTVTFEVWFGTMLAACVTGWRSLMRITIWNIPILGFLPIGLAFVI